MNKVQLQGNIGSDVKNCSGEGKKTFCKFSVATHNEFKDKNGEMVKAAEWHNIVCFGDTAEDFIARCAKGDKVYVEGRLKTRSYEKEGVKKYITEVMMEKFKKTSAELGVETIDDEIPF